MINSSDEAKEVPWIDCKEAPHTAFNGFEEASANDVNELTKVITSHHLYLDILGNSQKITIIASFNHLFIFRFPTSQNYLP